MERTFRLHAEKAHGTDQTLRGTINQQFQIKNVTDFKSQITLRLLWFFCDSIHEPTSIQFPHPFCRLNSVFDCFIPPVSLRLVLLVLQISADRLVEALLQAAPSP